MSQLFNCHVRGGGDETRIRMLCLNIHIFNRLSLSLILNLFFYLKYVLLYMILEK